MVVEPTVYDEVEQGVYEELWDTARMLTESEIKPYARLAFHLYFCRYIFHNCFKDVTKNQLDDFFFVYDWELS